MFSKRTRRLNERHFALAAALSLALAGRATGCDLCAIYGASSARGESSSGFIFSVSEQYIPFRTPQLNGGEVSPVNPDYLDRSITHLVPGYNFSPRFGLSLNVPLEYRSFRRTDVRYSLTAPPVFFTEQGTDFDLGDVALIGRFAVVQKNTMNYGVVVNLLGGVKFPTGKTGRIKDEVEQTEIFESFLPPGTPHDPLGHSVAGIHEHELSPGSSSFDGIFGLTLNSRWHRWFLNSQFQYYLRTAGESDFQFGNELIVSGGPGAYLFLKPAFTLSLQANATYEAKSRDQILGQVSDRTGWVAWYLGPQLALTIGEHLSANAGVDIPLTIANNGFQNVPDYVLHAGFAWRF